MTALELKSGQKIFYRKSEYSYVSPCVLDRKFIYAKNLKQEIVKKLPLAKIRTEENAN